MYRSFPVLILLITGINGLLFSQDSIEYHFRTDEDSLSILFTLIEICKEDSQKIKYNDLITEIIDNALNDDASFNYPFDSVRHLGKLTSPDKLFRFYTWNLVFSDGTYRYFGFVQYYRKNKDDFVVYRLHDKSDIIADADNVTLYALNWYGALYYEIIKKTYSRRTYYTLLGWDGNNDLTRKKIIEIVRFSASGKPVFGASVFKFDKKKRKRIFFEYSAKTNMTLTYNEKYDMIIFDHLSPVNSSGNNLYQYYGSDFSNDALYFEKGKWHLIEDVDVRNPRMKVPKKKWHYNKSEDFVK